MSLSYTLSWQVVRGLDRATAQPIGWVAQCTIVEQHSGLRGTLPPHYMHIRADYLLIVNTRSLSRAFHAPFCLQNTHTLGTITCAPTHAMHAQR